MCGTAFLVHGAPAMPDVDVVEDGKAVTEPRAKVSDTLIDGVCQRAV